MLFNEYIVVYDHIRAFHTQTLDAVDTFRYLLKKFGCAFINVIKYEKMLKQQTFKCSTWFRQFLKSIKKKRHMCKFADIKASLHNHGNFFKYYFKINLEK